MKPPERSQRSNVAVAVGALLLAVACCAGPYLAAAVAAITWVSLVTMVRAHAEFAAVALAIVLGFIFVAVGLVNSRIIRTRLTSKVRATRASDVVCKRVSALGDESHE